jgi:hypothetical protein
VLPANGTVNGGGGLPEVNTGGGTPTPAPIFDLKIYPFPTANKPIYLGRLHHIGPLAVPVYDNRFMILPNGSGGMNIDKPRVAWDVLLNTTNPANTPVAIFGSKNPAIGGIPANFTRHIQFVPKLEAGVYNEITQSADLGIFFTDGLQTDGSNANAGLVLAPYDKALGTLSTRGIRITSDGAMGIGTPLTSNPFDYRLAVNGTIGAKEVNVEVFSQTWPDYVFNPNYKLPSLYDVEKQIDSLGHLPGIPSASEVAAKGLNLGENQKLLLLKLEEITLYMIELKKQNDLLKKEIELLKSME